MNTSPPLAARSTSTAGAAWKILADSAGYRIKKREAGNLVTSITLAIALGLAPWDIGYRLAFGAGLNIWVYLVNDCFDVEVDLRAPGRDHSRARFLFENLRVGWAVSTGLALVLAAFAFAHSLGLLLALVSTVVVIVAYSGWLKRLPVVDILSMAAWGLTMALVGFPLDSAAGWRFASLLVFLCMVTEAVQVLRDEPSDKPSGVRTTAVVFGPRATAWVARLLMVASAAYASLFLHRFVGPVLLLGVLVPLKVERATRSWDALRLLFGLSWLVLLGLYYFSGELKGWVTLG